MPSFTPPTTQPRTSSSKSTTKTVRTNRFGRWASVSISSLVFIILLIPVALAISFSFELIFPENSLPRLIGEDKADVLLITIISISTYLVSRAAFNLFRYRLVTVPVTACEACHYDLANNTSGICPECGTRIITAPELQARARKSVRWILSAVVFIALIGAGIFFYSPWGVVAWFGPGGTPLIVPQVQPIVATKGFATANLKSKSVSGFISGTVILEGSHSANQIGRDQTLEDSVIFINSVNLREDAPENLPPVQISVSATGFQPKHVCVIWKQFINIKNTGTIKQPIMMVNRSLQTPSVYLDSGETLSTNDYPRKRFSEISNLGFGESITYYGTPGDTAFVHVFDHRYFCLSDLRGDYACPLPPPGEYELICEHLKYGRLSTTIKISDEDANMVIDFTYDDR